MGRVVVGGKLGERARIRQARTEQFRVLPLIKEQALAEFGPDEDRDPLVIHPSEMAKADWCHRATYYRISGRPEPDRNFNWVLETIFAAGNDAHEKYQRWMRQTGKLYGSWECLSCYAWWRGVSGELPGGCHMDDIPDARLAHVWAYREVRLQLPGLSLIAGRADGGIDNALIECKTIGIGTLRVEAPKQLKKFYNAEAKLFDLDGLWKSLSRPLPGHVRQANVYLWLAEQCNLPFKQMNFIYEFKPNQQTKEFTITKSDKILQPLLAKAREVEEAILNGEPPPCEFGGCEQCQAYEETDDSTPEKSPEPDRKARRVVTGSRTRSGEAGPDTASSSGRRTSGGSRRGADRAARPRADGPVREAEPVGRISRRSASSSGGGRVVRRQAGGQADRSRPDQGEE